MVTRYFLKNLNNFYNYFTDSGGCWNGWIVSETVNSCPRYTYGIATLVGH